MVDDYLDITKSVLISSPAGSGKTEKLARRYISLLQNGSGVERILAITFTDKAAAEMKERVLNILSREDIELFEKVRLRMPRMRISTIHSFCLKLLKRFCLDLGIDPSLRVMDSFNASILWSEAVYNALLEDNRQEKRLFYEIIKGLGVRGWGRLYRLLGELHSKRPLLELAVTGNGIRYHEEADAPSDYFKKIIALYSKCLSGYKTMKLQRHLIDYNDIELMAYFSISKNPEWQNVLYSFDEHTDHILVDEFQDTSSLQWKIIDKLTEEWRSGIGSKRDAGTNPTIFLVGDDKQSIYSFRGANVEIFRNAGKRLNEWLGSEYSYIEVKENYRSLPAIVDFVNSLFEKLMPRGLYEDMRIGYAPFEATREGSGKVELKVIESSGNMKENRKSEARVMAQNIKKLCAEYMVHEDGSTRPCRYGDMAILLRGRTHLSTFEDSLRSEGIPFVVVKGIGFYNSPEIAVMKSALFFLIDPTDNYSLVNILRSPLFSLDYRSISAIVSAGASPENRVQVPYGKGRTSHSFIFQIMRRISGEDETEDTQGRLWSGQRGGLEIDKERIKSITGLLTSWREAAEETPYSVVLETILVHSGAWRFFHEKQRYLNIKKFIKLTEDLEAEGLSGHEIREKIINSEDSDEPKANVNTEGMDAVRILTIHASKGLQFPMVFVPSLDEENRSKSGDSILMEEEDGDILLAYEDDSAARREMPLFRRQRDKMLDEEKRLFYVAATRAMDYLCMSGTMKDKPTGKLAYLYETYGLDKHGQNHSETLPFILEVFGEDDSGISGLPAVTDAHMETGRKDKVHSAPPLYQDVPQFIEPIYKDYRPSYWLDVTEEIDSVRIKHGEGWVMLGRAFHRLFEGLSKASITMGDLGMKIDNILKNETLSDKDASAMKNTMFPIIERLENSGLLKEIILPTEGSFAEMPFILEKSGRVYKGRIDRIIIKDGTARIYDYKTYPAGASEIPEIMRRYSFQMDIYREAAERLFRLRTEAFLFLTHEPSVISLS